MRHARTRPRVRKSREVTTWLALLWLAFGPGTPARAQSPDDRDIPTDAPQDAVMATAAEVQQMQDWASAAFTGHRAAGRESPA